MNVTIAIDSFKGSLTSVEAGETAAEGIRLVYPDAQIKVCPLADGGEGTVEAITRGCGGRLVRVSVTGPLGRKVDAEYGVTPDGCAVIEMSSAAGITLIDTEERNPLYTTTYGVGELILHAIRVMACRKFIIGIGGSATNDGGVGMLSALGFEFLTDKNEPIDRGAIGLSTLAKIVTENAAKELWECEFHIACDVKNPLCGEQGCSAIFGPQKGATQEMIADMDKWLRKYAALAEEMTGVAAKEHPGAGAAGGMGFAFISFLGGKLESGIELVIRETNLEKYIKESDIVITGEGRLDGQSCMGKAPIGVARVAEKYGKPTIAFAGAVTRDAKETNKHGITASFPILRSVGTLNEAMDKTNSHNNLKEAVEQAFRLIKALKD